MIFLPQTVPNLYDFGTQKENSKQNCLSAFNLQIKSYDDML